MPASSNWGEGNHPSFRIPSCTTFWVRYAQHTLTSDEVSRIRLASAIPTYLLGTVIGSLAVKVLKPTAALGFVMRRTSNMTVNLAIPIPDVVSGDRLYFYRKSSARSLAASAHNALRWSLDVRVEQRRLGRLISSYNAPPQTFASPTLGHRETLSLCGCGRLRVF